MLFLQKRVYNGIGYRHSVYCFATCSNLAAECKRKNNLVDTRFKIFLSQRFVKIRFCERIQKQLLFIFTQEEKACR